MSYEQCRSEWCRHFGFRSECQKCLLRKALSWGKRYLRSGQNYNVMEKLSKMTERPGRDTFVLQSKSMASGFLCLFRSATGSWAPSRRCRRTLSSYIQSWLPQFLDFPTQKNYINHMDWSLDCTWAAIITVDCTIMPCLNLKSLLQGRTMCISCCEDLLLWGFFPESKEDAGPFTWSRWYSGKRAGNIPCHHVQDVMQERPAPLESA